MAFITGIIVYIENKSWCDNFCNRSFFFVQALIYIKVQIIDIKSLK